MKRSDLEHILRPSKRIANRFEKRARANRHPASGHRLPSAAGDNKGRAHDGDSDTSTLDRVPDPASLELDACWEEQWQKHVFEAAVAKVKARVSPLQFQMFEWYTLREWPLRRVAQTLGVSAASVDLAKHRIAAALKREVSRMEQ